MLVANLSVYVASCAQVACARILKNSEWENTAARFRFTLPMNVSHGGIKQSMNNKESAQSLPLSTVQHCDSSSELLLVDYFKKKYFQR